MANQENERKRRTRITVKYSENCVGLNSCFKNVHQYKRELIKKEKLDCNRNGDRNSVTKKFRTISSYFLYILFIVPFVTFCSVCVTAEGDVGCMYVPSLCTDGLEFCYDDLVFGKCLSRSGVEMEDIDRVPLTEDQSGMLASMLEEMQGAGLEWDHPFVQCRIQGALFAMRRRTQLPPNLCGNLAPNADIFDAEVPSAFIRFTPPNNNDEYADEIYYPPSKKETNEHVFFRSILPTQKHRIMDRELASGLTKKQRDFINEHPYFLGGSLEKQELVNRLKDLQNHLELRKMLSEYERNDLKSLPKNKEIYFNGDTSVYNEQADENFPEQVEAFKRSKQGITTVFREISRKQHLPSAREYEAQLPSQEYINQYKKSTPFLTNMYDDELDLPDNLYDVGDRKPSRHNSLDHVGVYTEGGFFIPSESKNNDNARKDEARTLLANMLGFTRRERLDVKKPGPLIGPPENEKSNKTSETSSKKDKKEILPTHIKNESIKKAKNLIREHSAEDHAPYSVDTEYAFVIMKQPIDSWADGVRIVNALANTLQMNFTHPRVDSREVSFRVEPNPEKKSATDVARSINADRFKSNIYRRFGITVLRAGVGNKVKYDPEDEAVQASKMELSEEGPDVTHIMAYMFAGAGTAAAIVIIVVLLLIKRHDKKRDKLGGLQNENTANESCSKDYQELCRARMAAKSQSQDSPGGNRINALSKENERPPSSRSSTSSWSEEPALTNMDISTGHMVLSYMEDHLRNKGRLQREWDALCRYEAEPSARDAALQEECSALNRSNAPLPYDHSRVVLNHLANAEGLDYINASTITDHDPRAPAYVAAQGPLPTTLAHFWQMIWEQGAVVIVSLCRLQENSESACARYWPEEGAEVYHIYEVHLVSEHIWCDDYLVRSFYLKNLRTSETRTVTQFHFLSWPQGGVPLQAKALLEFRRKVNKSYRGRSCPIVVHGSNGAGRTGAYILLDLVLGRMNKGAREIDIAATLEHLRDQRAGLVATRQQFEFVLMAVAEEVHAILKALPANQNEKRDIEKEAVKEEDELNIKNEKQHKENDKSQEEPLLPKPSISKKEEK